MSSIKASRRGDVVDLTISGPVGAGLFGGVSLDDVTRAISDDGISKILLTLDSPGGDALTGVSIYTALSEHDAEVEVTVGGLAASAASVIAMAGDKVRMARGARMMLHGPWVVTRGNADELRGVADKLDALRADYERIYRSRAGEDAPVAEWLSGETYFDAEAAIAAGLADEVIEPRRRGRAKVVASASMAHPFAALIEPYIHPSDAAEAPQEESTMDLTPITAALGLADDSDEAAVTLAVQAVTQEAAEAKATASAILSAVGCGSAGEAVGRVEAMKAAAEQLEAAQARVAELVAAAESAEREAIVSRLRDEGKATAAMCAGDGILRTLPIESLRAFAAQAPKVAAPVAVDPPGTAPATQAEAAAGRSFATMTHAERDQLFREDPDTYRRLSRGE